jgi:hypothetical protein
MKFAWVGAAALVAAASATPHWRKQLSKTPATAQPSRNPVRSHFTTPTMTSQTAARARRWRSGFGNISWTVAGTPASA